MEISKWHIATTLRQMLFTDLGRVFAAIWFAVNWMHVENYTRLSWNPKPFTNLPPPIILFGTARLSPALHNSSFHSWCSVWETSHFPSERRQCFWCGKIILHDTQTAWHLYTLHPIHGAEQDGVHDVAFNWNSRSTWPRNRDLGGMKSKHQKREKTIKQTFDCLLMLNN